MPKIFWIHTHWGQLGKKIWRMNRKKEWRLHFKPVLFFVQKAHPFWQKHERDHWSGITATVQCLSGPSIPPSRPSLPRSYWIKYQIVLTIFSTQIEHILKFSLCLYFYAKISINKFFFLKKFVKKIRCYIACEAVIQENIFFSSLHESSISEALSGYFNLN